MSDEALESAAEAYLKVRDFLWCPIDRKHPNDIRCHNFKWGERPKPQYPEYRYGPLFSPLGLVGQVRPARDFPNDDFEWGHPTFASFLRWRELKDEAA